jgi:D-sedoheptulose 7-phosphate isomerase
MTVLGRPADAGDADTASRLDVPGLTRTYLAELTTLVDALDVAAIERIVELLRVARDNGRVVFIAGNGGSAATATHWVNDLAKATRRSGRRPFKVIGLSDNVSWLTAIANDDGYDRVFADQLDNLAGPDDVLLVITASGNSPNILRALELAAGRGMRTAALVGFDGGAARTMVDACLWVRTPKGAYGVVESLHSIVCDVVTTCLIADTASERGGATP